MCKELEEELKRGEDAARALVQHMENMGMASKAEMPVSHVNRLGSLEEWKVTVEVVSIIRA